MTTEEESLCMQRAGTLVDELNGIFQKLGSLGVQSRVDVLTVQFIAALPALSDIPLLQVGFFKQL